MPYGSVSILNEIASILADAGIAIFAVSTFNTDYVLVKEENYEEALELLKHNGYAILDSVVRRQ